MTIKIPVNSITVSRKGKQFIPPLNEPFDFTDSELNDLAELGVSHFVRDPVNESSSDAPAAAAPSLEDSVEEKNADDLAASSEEPAKETKTKTKAAAEGGESGNSEEL